MCRGIHINPGLFIHLHYPCIAIYCHPIELLVAGASLSGPALSVRVADKRQLQMGISTHFVAICRRDYRQKRAHLPEVGIPLPPALAL